MWSYVHPYQRLFCLSMLLMPLNSVFALAQPYVLKLTIDLFLTHNRTLPPRWLTPVLHAFGSHGLLAMGSCTCCWWSASSRPFTDSST